MSEPRATIGIIGGSGLYAIEGLADVEEVELDTPFGKPSDTIVLGTIDGVRIAFLPRHGRGHRILPTELPVRANIYALKVLGVDRIVSISAVGSLRAEIEPLHLVIPDQLIDRTRNRPSTFFGDGLVAHVAFADPFCAELSQVVYDAAVGVGATVHRGGSLVVIEGPAFSTKAESERYRSWGASIVGMTALPEAKLAREAEICYATVACSTDYDCWHPAHDSVTVEMVVQNLLRNVETSKRIVRALATRIPGARQCACSSALASAILTDPKRVPAAALERLRPLVGKYLSVVEAGS